MEYWNTFLLAMGGQAIVLTVLGWLARSLVTQLLAKDIETFKTKIKTEAEIEIHKIIHDLEKQSIEHHVRFSGLHEKRAEIIATLYSLIVQAHMHLEKVLDPREFMGDPSKKDQMANAYHSVSEFYSYFNMNKIYLPEYLCNQINSFVQEMYGEYLEYFIYARYTEKTLNDDLRKKWSDEGIKAWKYFQEVVPNAKSALEYEFRTILGDSTNNHLQVDTSPQCSSCD